MNEKKDAAKLYLFTIQVMSDDLWLYIKKILLLQNYFLSCSSSIIRRESVDLMPFTLGGKKCLIQTGKFLFGYRF